MDLFTNALGLTLLYVALLAIGIIYAVIILIGGGFGGVEAPGAPDLDISGGPDSPESSIPSLSPATVASFVTAFGAFGLIAMGLLNVTPGGSLVWAAGGGVVVAAIAHFALGYFLIAPQGSSEVKFKDIIGAVGEVSTPIPPDSVGAVTLVAQGGRVSYPAKSLSGSGIARGTTVVVDQVIGGVVVVRPQS